MRFIILFLFSIMSSWAIDIGLDGEMELPLPLKTDFCTIEIGLDNLSELLDVASPHEEEAIDSLEEAKALLPLQKDSFIVDIELETKLKAEPSLKSNLFEQNNCFLPTLIDDLFSPLICECKKLDACSLRRLFLVSKLLNERIGKLGINVWFPSLVLSFSPLVLEVLEVIDEIEKCQHSLGVLTRPDIMEIVQENPAYKAGIERLPRAEGFIHWSPTFLYYQGSKRINTIESFHKQRFQNLSPSIPPGPSSFRHFLSSITRDPWIFRVVSVAAVSSVGALSVMYYFHYAALQQYQVNFESNLKFTNTSEYIDQYYNGHNDGGTYFAKFPYRTPGCSNQLGLDSYYSLCFNIADYCQGGISGLANITDLATKLWEGFNLPSSNNISIENFQSAVSVFVNRACAENFEGNLSIAHSIARLKPNSSFLMTSEIISKHYLCDWEPSTVPILSSLFYCDALTIARGMTELVRPLWTMVEAPVVSLTMFGAAWITFTLERCFNLYDDS